MMAKKREADGTEERTKSGPSASSLKEKQHGVYHARASEKGINHPNVTFNNRKRVLGHFSPVYTVCLAGVSVAGRQLLGECSTRCCT